MKILTPISLLACMLFSCSVTENSTLPSERIAVAAGPEDMVIDYKSDETRLLISCNARREGEPEFGEILSYTLKSSIVDTLKRTGTPDSLFFQPHGIFLDSLSTPQNIYVISHEREDGFHPVYIYEVYDDTLVFKELAYSDLVHSPNALTLGEDGAIYIVNDSGKRGSMMEKAIKLNRANIVRMRKISANNWEAEIVAEKLGYPAGINRLGNILYAGDAVNNILHRYTINDDKLLPLDPIKGLNGNDNIRIIDGMLYLTGHVKPFKFISHVKSSKNLSPVEVWKVNPDNEEITSLFYTDGSLISAGSTAIVIDEYLYICQVFDPFILKVKLR